MCIYYLKISAHTSQKNAHPLYIDRPGTNAIHCQTQKNRRNALCGRNVEILKPTQVHSVSSNTANVSLLLITLVRVRTHARTHTHTEWGKCSVIQTQYISRARYDQHVSLTYSVTVRLPQTPPSPYCSHWHSPRLYPIGWCVVDR